MDVVVGLDSGTTSTKAVTAGADGRVRDVASVGYPLHVPAPGRAELDPHALQAAALTALAEVVSASRDRGDRVVGVTLCAAMHGLVPLDPDGNPTGPLVTWADDRAAAQAAALTADGRAAALHARTGTPVHPMSPLVKLAWWAAQDVASPPRWGGVKELLVGALCGPQHVVDVSCASATGLLDLSTLTWDEEALSIAGVRTEQLAELVPTTAVLPTLRADVGLPAGTPVVVGAADGVLANLGLGAVRPGVAALSIGTSGAVRTVVPRPQADDAGRLFCYALADDAWVVGGAVNNGGSVVRWAAEALAADDPADGEAADRLDARLLQEAADVPPGSDGLLCLPYLLGERAPWWRPGLRGAYLGLRRDHGRAHLVHAAVEGVCQQLALVRDALDALDDPVTEVRATGGALASPVWSRTLASTLDLPVRVADTPEGTGLGACLLGLTALGVLPDLAAAADLVPAGDAVEPDPEAAALYRRTRPLVERAALTVAALMSEGDAPGTASPG